jgi:hypothetical protein
VTANEALFSLTVPLTTPTAGEQIYSSAAQRAVYVESRAFDVARQRWLLWFGQSAKPMAEGDRDVTDDLVQGALAYLWELDPSRLDASDEPWLEENAQLGNAECTPSTQTAD